MENISTDWNPAFSIDADWDAGYDNAINGVRDPKGRTGEFLRSWQAGQNYADEVRDPHNNNEHDN